MIWYPSKNHEGIDLSKKFVVRCSPDCPYQDCIICLIDMPPGGQQQGQGGQQQDGNNANNSMDQQSSSGTSPSPQMGDGNGSGKSGGSSDDSEGRSGNPKPGVQPHRNDEQHSKGSGNDSAKENPGKKSGSENSPYSDRPRKEEPEQSKEQGQQKPEGSKGNSNQSENDESKVQPERGNDPKREEGNNSNPSGREKEKHEKHEKGKQGEPLPKPEPIETVEQYEYTPVYEEEVGPGGWGASLSNATVVQKIHKYDFLDDRVFQARLKNVMLDNAFDRRIRGRKRGKLDMRSLYKVPMKAENVFTLKQERKNKQYNIVLLVDESGSMMGDKAQTAADCAIFLAKAFENINIEIAIVGFNRYITTRKDFGQKVDYQKIHEAIATTNHGEGAGSNDDWDALNKGFQMFKPDMKGENILIMLSDGQPASSHSPIFVNSKGKEEKAPKDTDRVDTYQKDSITQLHHLVKANERKAKSVGIGIMRGGQQIPNHQVVNSVTQLKPAVIGLLEAKIKRG
jgi:cobalamin biosynthesis protein CobT